MKSILTNENKKEILSWGMDYNLNIDNIKFYFTHYAWENYNNDVNVVDSPINPTLQDREKAFKDIDADYIIFGHEHKSNCFFGENKVYYCLGSLGLKSPSGYLLIEIENGEVNLQEKQIKHDINYEIELMDKDNVITFLCLNNFEKYITGKIISEDGLQKIENYHII